MPGVTSVLFVVKQEVCTRTAQLSTRRGHMPPGAFCFFSHAYPLWADFYSP